MQINLMQKNVFLNRLTSFVESFAKSYRLASKVNDLLPALRLISIELNIKSKNIQFKIQIVGKNVFPIISLVDLKNPAVLSNFSKIDQDIINNYDSEWSDPKSKRIGARTYDREKKKFIFTVEFLDKELITRKCIVTDSTTFLTKEVSSFDDDDTLIIELESKEKLH